MAAVSTRQRRLWFSKKGAWCLKALRRNSRQQGIRMSQSSNLRGCREALYPGIETNGGVTQNRLGSVTCRSNGGRGPLHCGPARIPALGHEKAVYGRRYDLHLHGRRRRARKRLSRTAERNP